MTGVSAAASCYREVMTNLMQQYRGHECTIGHARALWVAYSGPTAGCTRHRRCCGSRYRRMAMSRLRIAPVSCTLPRQTLDTRTGRCHMRLVLFEGPGAGRGVRPGVLTEA